MGPRARTVAALLAAATVLAGCGGGGSSGGSSGDDGTPTAPDDDGTVGDGPAPDPIDDGNDASAEERAAVQAVISTLL